MFSLSLGQAGSPHFLIVGRGEGAQAAGTKQGWNRRQGTGEEGVREQGARVGGPQEAVEALLVGNAFASHVGTCLFPHRI